MSVTRLIGIEGEKVVLAFNRPTPRGLSNDDLKRFVGRAADVVVPYSELFGDAADRGKPLFTDHPNNAAVVAILNLAQLCVQRLAGRTLVAAG